MQCPKCKSEDLMVVKANMHNKLICRQCLAYVKFLSNKDTKTFLAITGQRIVETMPAAPAREGDIWELCRG